MEMNRTALAKVIRREYKEYGWSISEIEKKIEEEGCETFTRVDAKYIGFGKFVVKH